MKRFSHAGAAVALSFCLAALAMPRVAAESLASCRAVDDPASRLDCYDRLAERSVNSSALAGNDGYTVPAGAQKTTTPASKTKAAELLEPLVKAWRLGQEIPQDMVEIVPYRPVYLIVRRTNDPNEQPGNQALGFAPRASDIDSREVKFQVSFKTELLSPKRLGFINENLRLWFAYTQQSNWQVFDTSRSRPFRDNNYEPELILTYDNRTNKGQYGPDLVNLGFVHQSNGRSNPESRSWNRLYLQGGWQGSKNSMWENVSLLARGWWSSGKEDNPDINDYVGRGDVVLRWEPNKTHKVSLLARHNLRLNPGRGFVQADWAIDPGDGFPAFHVQATSGYGESLLDYNHRQRTLGIGLSFGKW